MTKTASCNCGALTVEVSGEPEAVVACHCTDCQRRTGSVLGVGAYYAATQVKISGASTSFTRGCASGRSLTQNFCPTCGTSVYWTADLKPNVFGVAVGCFADPTFLQPVRSVWEQSQHPWLGLPEGIAHYPKGRSA
jgi:hypothetical protein